MLKVNLLGKKKKPVPFGLDKVLEKAGVTSSQLEELRPSGKKIVAILAGMYLVGAIPEYWLEMKVEALQAVYNEVNARAEALRKELGGLKSIRQKMEALQKEEAEVDKQLTTIQALSLNRDMAFRAVNAILEVLPPSAWVEGIRYNERLFTVDGSAWEYFTVNDFVRALSENTRFKAVTLRGIKAEAITGAPIAGIPSADQKTKTFQVEFLVNNMAEGGMAGSQSSPAPAGASAASAPAAAAAPKTGSN